MGHLNLRLEESLLAALDKAAAVKGLSRSEYVRWVLRHDLKAACDLPEVPSELSGKKVRVQLWIAPRNYEKIRSYAAKWGMRVHDYIRTEALMATENAKPSSIRWLEERLKQRR